MKRDIFFFMSVDWDHLWSAPQKTAVELSRQHRVFAFECVGFSRRLPQPSDFGRMRRRLKRFFKSEICVRENLFTCSLPVFPYLGLPGAESLSFYMQLAGLKRVIKKYGVENPLIWTCLPTRNILKFSESIQHCGLVYDCLDDFTGFRGAPKDLIPIERQICEKAVAVFSVSQKEFETKSAWNRSTYLLPNAADPEHFYQTVDPATPVAHELQGLPKPVVGFIGSFDDWVDLDLVAHLAREKPDWSFVMIGPIDGDRRQSVPPFSNLHFIGRQKYEQLPQYLKGIDVVLLPFQTQGHIESSDPIMMYDCLAAGKPVVSTDIPAARAMGNDLVQIGSNSAEMAKLIEVEWESLQDLVLSEERALFRLQSVRERTWRRRASRQLSIIENGFESARTRTFSEAQRGA